MEQEAFEARLMNEQEAQEQLAEAVQLTLALQGKSTHPNPMYRKAVREAILPLPTILPSRRTRFIPTTRILLGTIALSLLVGLSWVFWPLESESIPVRVSPWSLPAMQPKVEVVLEPESPEERVPDMVEIWSDLTNLDHFRTSSDEDRRKNRSREHGHSVLQSVLENRLSSMD